MILKESKRTVNIFQEKVSEVSGHPMADQDALNDKILPSWRHRVGRHLPSTSSEPIGKIVECEAVVPTVSECPANCR